MDKMADRMNSLFRLIKRIVFKLYREIVYMLQFKQYGAFGKNSRVVHPMRIINKQYIFIGRNVLIMHYARIESIDRWIDKRFNPKITIEDNVTIGQGLHLTCANEVIIHEGCSITP
jgi:acetyltransferase-like isoleucine patch superfamily enzyme